MEQRAIAECGCGIEEKARKAGKADSKAVSWREEEGSIGLGEAGGCVCG